MKNIITLFILKHPYCQFQECQNPFQNNYVNLYFDLIEEDLLTLQNQFANPHLNPYVGFLLWPIRQHKQTQSRQIRYNIIYNWFGSTYKYQQKQLELMSVGKARNNLFELIQKQLKKRPNPELYNSPEHRPSNDLKQTKSRSLFLTQFDRMEKTKALWRNLKPINHKNNKQDPSVCSWAELDRLKNKYRTELLRRKSKEQIFQENMNMILKIEQIPPQVETWNLYKPKKSSRSSSNEDLLIKNLELIKKIEETEPKVENWNIYKPKKSPRSLQRTKEKLKIFEQNMKIIDNIQAAPPKVDSWSLFKPKRNKNLIIQRTKRKEKLFEQNMKIIQRVESIPPKVQSWADIKSMRKKAERKKSLENRSSQKIEKLKRMIEKVEENLYQQQLSQHKNRRMKTLPERIDRCEKYKANHDLTVKRLQVKIDKTKSNIDCWVKGKQLNKGARKNAVLCNAHKMKQIQRFKKNMESCLNLQGPSVKKF